MVKGLRLRDTIKRALVDHDLHRPRKDEWYEDSHMDGLRN